MNTTTLTRGRFALLSLPALVLMLPFFIACLYVFRFSFSDSADTISGFSLKPYIGLTDAFFLRSILVTLKLATLSTLICLLLGLPLAIIMANVKSGFMRRLLTILILLPMILNLLIQSYGWMIMLGPTGVVNSMLRSMGLIDTPLQMLFNEVGVLMGLVQTALPLAVFPILSAMRAISRDYLEAATNLGATDWRSFFDITLPLLRPGLISAASIVFAYNASAFAVPRLLGGKRVQMVGVAINDMISPMFDWAGAAAAGAVLIVLTVVTLLFANWLANRLVTNRSAA